MHWRYLVTFMMTAFASMGAATAEEGPRDMVPAGAWTADFANDSCSLERKFRDDEHLVTLRLRQFGPQRDFEITLVSNSLDLSLRNARYAFFPGDKQDLTFYQTFKLPGGERGVLFTGTQFKPDPDSAEGTLTPATGTQAAQSIERLTLENVFRHDITLRTGTLQEPLQIMQKCLDDLLSSWGLDAQAHHDLSRPVTDPEGKTWPGWLDSNQSRALSEWPSDRMQFRLLVDERGHAIDCRMMGAEQLPDLSKRICEVMLEDYQFLPALDVNKQPIQSYYLSTMSRIRRAAR